MIKFGMPEVLSLCATSILISGNSIIGYCLLGFAIFWAFGRFSLEVQEKKERREEIEKAISAGGDVLGSFAKLAGTIVASGKPGSDDKPRWN